MSRIHVAAIVALSALALPASTAFAQIFFGGANANADATSNQGRATGADVEHCGGAAGGSRVRENCEPEQVTTRAEQELKLAIQVPAIVSKECSATTTTEYMQLNTKARVNSQLAISDCAAASGGFRVVVRLRDESGAEKPPLEFNETWQRTGTEDVKFTADYPIGDTELVSVRVRGLTCTCAAVADESNAGSTAPTVASPAQ